MKSLLLGLVLMLPALMNCGDYHQVWHNQVLPSGKMVKITSFHLVWGVEHDERDPGKDCFALEFVFTNPQADPQVHEQEAWEVFELIRPISELWGFNTATLAGFPTTQRKGAYDLFVFNRPPDGKWSSQRYSAKVFAND